MWGLILGKVGRQETSCLIATTPYSNNDMVTSVARILQLPLSRKQFPNRSTQQMAWDRQQATRRDSGPYPDNPHVSRLHSNDILGPTAFAAGLWRSLSQDNEVTGWQAFSANCKTHVQHPPDLISGLGGRYPTVVCHRARCVRKFHDESGMRGRGMAGAVPRGDAMKSSKDV